VVSAPSSWRWCPGSVAVPALARSATDSFLDGTPASPETRFHARLVVSELISNAVRHGGADLSWVELRLEAVPGAVRGSVHHPGAGFAAPATAPPVTARGGRGLFLVAALTSAWGITVENGTTVWFEISMRS
jgi:anti-sigma regulatory factor (Ser/Thr protein kinase)